MAYVHLHEDPDTAVASFSAGPDGERYEFRPMEDGELTKAFRLAVADAVVGGALGELGDVEREVAREMAEQVGIRKDASDSLMIAWYPPAPLSAQLLALLPAGLNGVPPEQVHLTLAYLGDPDKDGSGPWDPTLIAAVCKIFSTWSRCLEGSVSGIGRFVGPEDTDVLVALIDVPELNELRQCLINELACYGAIPYNSPLYNPVHGYVPHITLAYVPKGTQAVLHLDAPIPVCLDGVAVCVGGQSATFQFATAETDAVDAFSTYYATQKAARQETPVVAAPDAVAEPLLEALAAGAGEVEDPGALYSVTKALDEDRFTLGPLYAPMRKDAHGDVVDPDELQKACWEYVRASAADGRRIHLQHDAFGDVTVGEWVECMAWPYDHEITLKQADGTEVQQAMPAGTVYLGVQWDPEAWDLVKSGKLGGYSFGGRAVKIELDEEYPRMGYSHPEMDAAEKGGKPSRGTKRDRRLTENEPAATAKGVGAEDGPCAVYMADGMDGTDCVTCGYSQPEHDGTLPGTPFNPDPGTGSP